MTLLLCAEGLGTRELPDPHHRRRPGAARGPSGDAGVPSNPLLAVADLEAICAAARKPGAIVAVDNTFAAAGVDLVLEDQWVLLADGGCYLLNVCFRRGNGRGPEYARAFESFVPSTPRS